MNTSTNPKSETNTSTAAAAAAPQILLDQRRAAEAMSLSVRSFQRLRIKPVRLPGLSKPLYTVESLRALIPQE